MATFLLKKSYQLNNLKEIKFNDLWGDHGVFTTMWIFNKPFKILFFKDHIENLVKSVKNVGSSAGSLFVFKGKFDAVLINYLDKHDKEKLNNISFHD